MEATLNQTAVKDITMVAISAIRPNGFNPRKHFDEASLNELADSIRQQGMLQPVTVRPTADNGYELVFGERRYRAATIVGMQEIPAIISDLSDEEAEEIAITENLQRKDVTPMEEANAYQRLMESGRHDLSSLRAVRQERGIYPHTAEIRIAYPRNSHPVGNGRNHGQRGK